MFGLATLVVAGCGTLDTPDAGDSAAGRVEARIYSFALAHCGGSVFSTPRILNLDGYDLSISGQYRGPAAEPGLQMDVAFACTGHPDATQVAASCRCIPPGMEDQAATEPTCTVEPTDGPAFRLSFPDTNAQVCVELEILPSDRVAGPA